MNVTIRQPSTAWEPVLLPEAPAIPVWVWFKPIHAPHDVVLQIPDDAYRSLAGALTVRRLLAGAGISLAEAHSWTVHGVTCLVQGGANSLLDQPIPSPGLAGVVVHLDMAAVTGSSAATAGAMPFATGPTHHGSLPATDHALATLEAIDAEWQAIILLERQLDAIRRQLGGIQGTLQSLNRDLDPDERLYSDSNQKKDWQDTRRWLRDALAHVSRAIRAHDIGITSAAGNRRRFEQIYQEYVEPRRSFPGIDAEQIAFEQHRKSNQNLLQQMQFTYASASRDGIQRARQVLSQIASKVRAARAKR